MSRYTKTQVTQLSANEQAAIDNINKNFDDIQSAIQDAVSRSGNTPTHMTHDLDMNGKRIINVPAPLTDTDLVRRQDVVGDIALVQNLVNATTNAAAQTLQAAQEVQEIIQDRNVGLVADDLALGDDSKIKQVAGNKDNIDLVASLDDDIEAVAALKDDIPVVVQAAEDIDKVEDIAEDITAVANNVTNVTAVAENEENINAVNANKTNINAVNANKTNIDAVASNQTNINTVAGISSAVSTVASNTSNVSNVSTNMSDVNYCATNMSAIQDAPNQAQAAADSAALAYQYGNDKINQTHISNCLTDIPQDIKLELNSGTITVKAGSKIYIPNGFESDGTTLKFDTVILENDETVGSFGTDVDVLQFRFPSGTFASRNPATQVFSGSTAPTSATYMIWYDTTNNLVKITSDSGSTWTSGASFPISLSSTVSSSYTSIKQVFNGFGYIGSTVFALPGVKGLIPNGRNDDGTLKNIEFAYNNVLTKTFTGTAAYTSLLFKESDIREGDSVTYKESTNYNEYGHNDTDTRFCIVGSMTITSGVISNWNPKTVFHALDWSDILTTLYPVGSLYIGTQNNCPLATLISGSSWEIVATNKALWGGDGSNANTTIAAGLPNITGYVNRVFAETSASATGALKLSDNYSQNNWAAGSTNRGWKISLNASRSSSVYGNSSTVQPPAYRVNVWRRTA